MVYFPKVEAVKKAQERLRGVSLVTPLKRNESMSNAYGAEILFKREDLQVVRSYKIRGAYNKIASLSPAQKGKGVVCASAGNHAQGVAYSCRRLSIRATIFMPLPTPAQKIEQVKMFGGEWIDLRLSGDTFDEAKWAAQDFCSHSGAEFIHPFEDPKVMEGQGTIGLEILAQSKEPIDYLFMPVGGGGLAAGLSAVFKTLSPHTKLIGVEPLGAPSMSTSLRKMENTFLPRIDKFVDGAAVQKVGDLNFEICQHTLDAMLTVEEGRICELMLEMYNKEAIVLEPAAALSIAGLDAFGDDLKSKRVVCLISGSNNDISRTSEVQERAILYKGLKHYFLVKFPQRPGALREFIAEVLGPQDDIVYFQYIKRNSRERGAAVVGIELKAKEQIDPLQRKIRDLGYFDRYLNESEILYSVLT